MKKEKLVKCNRFHPKKCLRFDEGWLCLHAKPHKITSEQCCTDICTQWELCDERNIKVRCERIK